MNALNQAYFKCIEQAAVSCNLFKESKKKISEEGEKLQVYSKQKQSKEDILNEITKKVIDISAN